MAKVRTTLTVERDLLRAVKIAAARSGTTDSQFIEEALRDRLGFAVLDRLWAQNDMAENEATELALEAQRATRSAVG